MLRMVDRHAVKQMLTAGMTQREVARHFGISKRTVRQIGWFGLNGYLVVLFGPEIGDRGPAADEQVSLSGEGLLLPAEPARRVHVGRAEAGQSIPDLLTR